MAHQPERKRFRTPAVFLAFSAVLLGLALAMPQAVGSRLSFEALRFPIIELEARKQNTERGLDTAVNNFEREAPERLSAVVRREIVLALPLIEASYERAKDEVDRTIGAVDAIRKEQRERKIDAAFRNAKVDESIQDFRRRLEEGVGREALSIYAEELSGLFQIVEERYSEGIPGEFQRYIRENLAQKVSDDARARLGETGQMVGDTDVPVPLLPLSVAAAAILVRRLVVNNLGRAMVRQLGGTVIGRALTGVGKLFGPVGLLIDLVVAIGSLAFAWEDVSNQTRSAIRERIDENYQVEVRAKLLDAARINAIATELAGPLVGELKRARTVMVESLGRTYDCVVVQGAADGAEAYVESLRRPGQSEDDFQLLVADRLEQLCRVFGLDYQDISFDEKSGLIDAVGIGPAADLIKTHGRRFIDLFNREREPVTRLARLSGDDPAVLSQILDAEDERAELDFFLDLLSRLNALSPDELGAAVLVRSVLPDVQPIDYTRTGLGVIAGNLENLRSARNLDPETGRLVLADVLDQDMTPRSLQAITSARDRSLLNFLYALWRDAGARQFDDVMEILSEPDRRRFLREMGQETAAQMLRSEIATQVVRVFTDPARGGRRGAIVYFNLYRENRGPLDEDSARIVEWLITSSDIAPEFITRDLVQDMRALQLRNLPDFVAKPVATILAYSGLTMLLALLVVLVVLPVLTFLIRLAFPRRRAERVVIERGTRRGGKGDDLDG